MPAVAPRRWKPAPAFSLSAAVHAGAAAALVATPSSWPWAIGALAANHAVLAVAGLLPRSRLLGPNLTRLPAAAVERSEIAITFDDGPDPAVTPRVLDALDAAGAKATFFLIGERAERYPRLAREIVARGHAAENHSHRHSTSFGWYGLGRTEREIAAAQAAIEAATGVTPLFFRAPFGMRNPLLEPALCRVGLQYVSWTRRAFDTVARDPARVLGRLADALAPGAILLLHDGTGRTGLAALPGLLAAIAACGLRPVTLRAALRRDA
jgi:peptidoglycan/xylan/chitin deacetylase (PgdA/CDA1 family)